ncbi:CorA family divalent cation transporter [Candidatus Thiodictyon syntrophicum]|uniref:Magnesium transporter CorA n=1 Tax=Candidatus Thiodictyon syntrophicum TaxID=1166950 RepID=A0A2K8U7Y4_9GAMM|nr:CorA family divalent cation transporter [Candidatus Thiodictyon syntrophicum]AUB81657.1 magnesium transporter CorA [Candidatus Thiodictyon syntrophicum]
MSRERMIELLNKHRLVEDLVHNQHQPRQALVETIVARQHLAELHNLLMKLPADDIARVLESLSGEEAVRLWTQVTPERQSDILWEVSDHLGEQLAGAQEPGFSDSQMNAYELVAGRLRQVSIRRRRDLEGLHTIWVDLLNATKTERTYIGKHFGLVLPDPGEATDLEVSSRFHVEEDQDIHLHSNFLLDREGDSRSVPVVFIQHQGILFSVRNEELPVFRLLRRRATTLPDYASDCKDLLLDLYGTDVEYSADSLEDIYATLGKVGRQVLSGDISDDEAAAILADIAEEEDLNGRIRNNILDTQRALSFLMRCKILTPPQRDDAQQILRDIESLNSHTAFLFDKINFLMDATIGVININQNKRLSRMTVFGVVFMPLNILAGIGGMSEFSMMTAGLAWPVAYGAFVVAMMLLGWSTYVAVRHFENRKVVSAARAERGRS